MYSKELREEKMKKGLCICGKPLAQGKTYCVKCLEIQRDSSKRIREKHKLLNLCKYCNKPIFKSSMCEEHLKRERDYKKTHKKLISKLCKQCGKPLDDGRTNFCETHKANLNKSTRTRENYQKIITIKNDFIEVNVFNSKENAILYFDLDDIDFINTHHIALARMGGKSKKLYAYIYYKGKPILIAKWLLNIVDNHKMISFLDKNRFNFRKSNLYIQNNRGVEKHIRESNKPKYMIGITECIYKRNLTGYVFHHKKDTVYFGIREYGTLENALNKAIKYKKEYLALKEENKIKDIKQGFCNSINCNLKDSDNKDEKCNCNVEIVINYLIKENIIK